METRRERSAIWIVALLSVLYLVVRLPTLYAEYQWFAVMDYDSVFLTVLSASVGLFVVGAVASFAALYANYRVTVRAIRRFGPYDAGATPFVVVVLLSLWFGLGVSGAWPMVLRFIYGVPFDIVDPVYGRDVSFYVFTLPFLDWTVGVLLWLTFAAGAFALGLYGWFFGLETHEIAPGATAEAFDTEAFAFRLSRYAYDHLTALAGVGLILIGAEFALRRWALVFSRRGAVYGAGATDLAVHRPVLGLLAVAAVAAGIGVVASRRIRDARWVILPVAGLLVILIAGTVVGGIYQSYVVEPDEFNKEAEYIEHEIEFTRRAFALDAIDERDFPVSDTLSASDVEDNPGTIENIRLWDWRPLLTTLNELQIFRTYYRFNDVDVDRYEINGRETQVMVAAREIDFDALPPESQTWVNRHLVYTHGFGVTMSPVSQVSSEGLPELYIKDIPPNSTVDVRISQPRIYYGESTDTYALVNSGTRELDYPSGGENVYTTYDGPGGVPLSSPVDEVAYAIRFGAPQILVSDSVTSETRIQLHRNIDERVRTIAPFLEYDEDPYVVIADGRLYWIYDAYTTTDNYPYSRPIQFDGERTNYLRNSVKVVVDAYTGEITYYVADQDDPMIRTYGRVFPGLFRDLEAMPPSLRDNVRYPQDAFEAQSEVYLDYHMTDPRVFYNKEDAWRVPDEIVRGNRVQMEPYYVIMTFPDERDPEFVQIMPFIPEGRQNMIGWLAARSDRPNYGEFRAFLFSKQRLVFGPMQIESRIDQDTEISQRITLWSQAGSNVIRGNLLAIPIEDTVIYVEPLYLESQEEGALPELKRVIVAQGDGLTMQPSLQRALAVRFGDVQEAPPGGSGSGVSPGQLEQMRTLYQEAQAALRQGDLETYAQKIDQLGDLIESTQAGTGNTTRTETPPARVVPAD